VIPIRALFYGLADGVPVLAQRFFRWPPNKALRNEAANNHFMLTRARESRLVEALPICSGERHRILGSKAKGGLKNTVTACVMRGCHQVISLGRAVGVSRCPGVVMLGFFLLGEGDQSDSAVS